MVRILLGSFWILLGARVKLSEETERNDAPACCLKQENQTLNWEEHKEKRKRESLERHSALSKLFKEDRFAFELERKRLIEEVIQSARSEKHKEKLTALQASWDKRMKGAGSSHNRFLLAQAFFWDHVQYAWLPALQEFKGVLKKKGKV